MVVTLFADMVENNKLAQKEVGNILLEILRYLHTEGEFTLANSIWQSFRVDALLPPRKSNFDQSLSDSIELPDDVDSLMLRDDLIRDPWQLFQLERDSQESFYQVWLIDRIMRYGSVWVGSYLKRDCDREIVRSGLKASLPSSLAPSGSSLEIKTSFQGGEKTILMTQLAKQLLASVLRVVQIENSQDDESTASKKLNSGAYITFIWGVTQKVWTKEAEARRA